MHRGSGLVFFKRMLLIKDTPEIIICTNICALNKSVIRDSMGRKVHIKPHVCHCGVKAIHQPPCIILYAAHSLSHMTQRLQKKQHFCYFSATTKSSPVVMNTVPCCQILTRRTTGCCHKCEHWKKREKEETHTYYKFRK